MKIKFRFTYNDIGLGIWADWSDHTRFEIDFVFLFWVMEIYIYKSN